MENLARFAEVRDRSRELREEVLRRRAEQTMAQR
jgi:hypothetical protein